MTLHQRGPDVKHRDAATYMCFRDKDHKHSVGKLFGTLKAARKNARAFIDYSAKRGVTYTVDIIAYTYHPAIGKVTSVLQETVA